MSTLFDSASTYGRTLNGAMTYTSTLKNVLDLFSLGGALRNRPENEVVDLISKAFDENALDTIRVLLYLRDVRFGQGERRVYEIGVKTLKDKLNVNSLLEATIEIGSWRDVFNFFSFEEYMPLVKERYENHIKEGKYDLMEKWLPSVGGSKNKLANRIAEYLGLTPKQYRKYLSKARSSIDIVEVKMCANKWSNIKYDHVPSKASLNYRDAFIKHDSERYHEYLNDVVSGKSKINVKDLYPYEITGKYMSYGNKLDESLEVMWKNLPDYTKGENAIVVADTSGSMWGMPMNIATSLAIYFAEHNTGIFHNEYITFSESPKFMKFKNTDSLCDKVNYMKKHSIVANTNIRRVFEIILKAGKDSNLPKEEMPKTIYIISDMEFDYAVDDKDTNLEEIKKLYAESNYDMPNLVFWNVNSWQDTIPCRYNEKGVALVSGASPSLFKMVMSNDMNPEKFMYSVIDTERYNTLAKNIMN